MKKFFKFMKRIAFVGSILCIVLSSCSDMNELSDRFLDEGEITYAYKADSAVAHTGYKRVGIDIYIGSRRVDKARVYWNSYKDSLDVNVGNRSGAFHTFVENLEESMYVFYIVSIDSYGNKSLPVELSGEAVGDNFMSTLRNRTIVSAIYTADDEVTVKWGNSPNYSFGGVLSYTNTANQKATLNVPSDSTVTVIDDWKSGLSYYTRFIPAERAADTLRLDAVEQDVWIEFGDKSAWSVVDYTGGYYNSDYMPGNVIDGIPTTTWYTSTSENYPYYIVIDFGSALQIDGVVFQNRIDMATNDNYPKQVKWEAGNDLNEWTTILSLSALSDTRDELWLPCTVPTTAQYLKFNMYSGWKGAANGTFGEMGVFRIK